jgi:hypothetical protein
MSSFSVVSYVGSSTSSKSLTSSSSSLDLRIASMSWRFRCRSDGPFNCNLGSDLLPPFPEKIKKQRMFTWGTDKSISNHWYLNQDSMYSRLVFDCWKPMSGQKTLLQQHITLHCIMLHSSPSFEYIRYRPQLTPKNYLSKFFVLGRWRSYISHFICHKRFRWVDCRL